MPAGADRTGTSQRTHASATSGVETSVTLRTLALRPMLKLYQAEWCPYSSAVRELLNELGIPFVAQPVEPYPEERTTVDSIPTLVTDDGDVLNGTRAIFDYLEQQEPRWAYGAEHRQRFRDHRPARENDSTGQLIERTRLRGGGQPPQDVEAIVRDNEAEGRYELLLGDRLIGLAAYRRQDGKTIFTHTEVDPDCEGRGYGTGLVRAALEDVARRGEEVVALCPFVARIYGS